MYDGNLFGDECVYDGSWRNLEKFESKKDTNIKACAVLLLAPDLEPYETRVIQDNSGRSLESICEEKGRKDVSRWIMKGITPEVGLIPFEDYLMQG